MNNAAIGSFLSLLGVRSAAATGVDGGTREGADVRERGAAVETGGEPEDVDVAQRLAEGLAAADELLRIATVLTVTRVVDVGGG
jgi:hypothetical protein